MDGDHGGETATLLPTFITSNLKVLLDTRTFCTRGILVVNCVPVSARSTEVTNILRF